MSESSYEAERLRIMKAAAEVLGRRTPVSVRRELGQCLICGESIESDLAEMSNGEVDGLVHGECGLAEGWSVS
jgi:hypothetical protein